MEFERFCGISMFSRNLVLVGNIGDKYGIFWSGSGGCTVCTVYMILPRNTWQPLGSDGRNTANIGLNLSEILPVYLVDRLYLSVVVAGNKYCISGRVHGAVEN